MGGLYNINGWDGDGRHGQLTMFNLGSNCLVYSVGSRRWILHGLMVAFSFYIWEMCFLSWVYCNGSVARLGVYDVK